MCVIETSPVVETRRLVLRAPAPQDAPRIAALARLHPQLYSGGWTAR